jgi:hypothetical protein
MHAYLVCTIRKNTNELLPSICNKKVDTDFSIFLDLQIFINGPSRRMCCPVWFSSSCWHSGI